MGEKLERQDDASERDRMATANEAPTHMVLQFDSSHGGAYIGSVGNTLWVDNVRVEY